MRRASITLSILAAIAIAGCHHTDDLEEDDESDADVVATAVAHAPARAVEICSGSVSSGTGERCIIVKEEPEAIRCRHSTTRRTRAHQRHGDAVDTVQLELASDGSFVVIAESTTHERWSHSGRDIEITSRMFVEYHESADGQGQCNTGEGEPVRCARSDAILLDFGADPCTRDYIARVDG